MEADIAEPEIPVNKSGNDVFSRMVLHPSQSLFPVYLAENIPARFHISAAFMVYHSAFLKNVCYSYTGDVSRIRFLSATFREKSRSVEDREIFAFGIFLTFKHSRAERKQMTVNIIQLLSHWYQRRFQLLSF